MASFAFFKCHPIFIPLLSGGKGRAMTANGKAIFASGAKQSFRTQIPEYNRPPSHNLQRAGYKP
jgi:hypothetical protein